MTYGRGFTKGIGSSSGSRSWRRSWQSNFSARRTPISAHSPGNIAGIATTFALGCPGDIVLEVHNGHQYAQKLALSPLQVSLESIPIPWDGVRSNIDLDQTVALIQKHRPKLVTIGSGVFLFPQPVRELKEAMNRYTPDSHLIYDAAHVMGLIAGGRFQSPLEEGADVVISSTHKTLAGPQGGIILTNNRSLAERIGPAVAPLLESNHHLGRLPALAGTFLEWMACGGAHADAIISNAKTLRTGVTRTGDSVCWGGTWLHRIAHN